MSLSSLIEIILHLDKYLSPLVQSYGAWIYAILFLVIFFETGLVFIPFLPGDSLLFVAGTFAAQGSINLIFLMIILSIAAILGDTMNYWIGYHFGNFITSRRFVKQEYIQRTERFYEKHGKKTIILARFIPIIRTVAPFIAGIGKMQYPIFLAYNIIGGLIWVVLLIGAGYLFGNIPFVQENFTLFIIGIIIMSFIPVCIEYLRHRIARQKS